MTARKRRMIALVLIILAAASIVFALSVDAMRVNGPAISVLDQQQKNVEKMTAATAVIATGLAAVPGEATTPMADKLIDLSGYLVFVLCAVFLEKYLILVIWYLSLAVLIPIAFVMLAIYLFGNVELLKRLGTKFLVFAIAIGLAIPASVGITCLMDKTSDYLSVQQRVEKIEQNSDANAGVTKSNESKSLIGKIKAAVGGSASSLTSSAKKWIQKGENAFNNTIEAIALMIVTSCVLPILTFLFFIWLLKSLFSININLRVPKLRHGSETEE